jgi:CHAT domain-containing protein/tetratricopeptide (TPR) repeat protein
MRVTKLLTRPHLVCRMAVLGLVCLFVSAAAAAAAPGLADSVDVLRAQGRYDEAFQAARSLVDSLMNDSASRRHEREDARRLQQTLEAILALPPVARGRMAEADRLSLDADSLLQEGHFREAATAVVRALTIQREGHAADHVEIADNLGLLGVIHLYQNDVEAAEPALREALAMRRRLVGETHPDVAGDLANLSQLQLGRGDLAGAEPNAREAVTILRELGEEDQPAYALLVNNLASILLSRGDYAAAEPLFREALARLRTLRGEADPEVATLLANLASLQQKTGDDDQAEALYRESIELQKRNFPEGHPNTALFLNSLALLLRRHGELEPAERVARESLEMQQRLIGEEDPDLAITLRNLGLILADGEHYAEAAQMYRRAIRIWRAALGNEHPLLASGLRDLGQCLAALGDTAAAQDTLRQSLRMRERLLGHQHPYTVATLHDLGRLCAAQGSLAEAESLLTVCADRYEFARVRAGSGLERATFLDSPYADLAAVRLKRGRFDAAWPAAERELGRVLADLLRSAQRSGMSTKETAQRDSLSARLGEAEDRLQAFAEAVSGDSSTEAGQRVIEARDALLQAEADWRYFLLETADRHPESEAQAMPLERIQQALDPGSAIVGWCETALRPNEREVWAYVVRHTGGVHWVRAGSWDASRGSQRMLRRLLIDPEAPIAGVLRETQAVWAERFEPLLPFLDGVRHLVVLPSGDLLGLPLEALTDRGGAYLGDRCLVTYCPSASVYAWLEERTAGAGDPSTSGSGGIRALALGDPPFNEDQRRRMQEETADPSRIAHDDPQERRGWDGQTPRPRPSTLPRLPGSRAEVRALAATFPGTLSLLGPQASERRLKALAASDSLSAFRVVHLATHALVDDRDPAGSALVLSQVDLGDRLAAAIEGREIQDGLLTSREIVGEWVLQADVVTLSACETALGREVAGEGFVGLADAFLQVGARSVLVSLWEVDDRATALFMQRFYANLAEAWSRPDRLGRPIKAEALREARSWLREYRGPSGDVPYRHPYFWSAFVLIGSPE